MKQMTRQMKKVNAAKDKKMNAITELIFNIKMIKLYSWVDAFEK